jgi:beta-N-acetylhexosaminidase
VTQTRKRRAALLLALAVVPLLALLTALLPAGADEEDGQGAPRTQEALSTGKETVPGAEVTVLDALVKVIGPARGSDDVERFLARAPVERKVAQLFAIGFSGQDQEAPILSNLRRRDWGSLVLQDVNYVSATQVKGLIAGLQANARIGRDVPPLIAAAQEGGDRSAFADLPPGSQGSVASKGGVAGVAREARAAGKALRALGVTMTLAPSADVAAEGGPFEKRAFGVDEEFVAKATRAAVQGYVKAKVIPAVGSFPGAGASSQDPDIGPGPVGLSLGELRERDIRPFRAVAGLAPVVRMSNAIYAAFDGVTPATVLPQAVRLLRSLGFRGVVMTANLVGTTGVTGGTVPQAALAALKAGVDLIYIPGSADDQEEAYQAVLSAVRTGRISPARLDGSLRRVLELKRSYGKLGS